MNYYKQEGSNWAVFYAIDDAAPNVVSVELRSFEGNLESVLVGIYSPLFHNYDGVATEVIRNSMEQITYKEFQAARKRAMEWIKEAGSD